MSHSTHSPTSDASPNTLTQSWQAVCHALDAACHTANRQTRNVTLIAVSKKQSGSAIRRLYQLGQRHFGENFLQEAELKQAQLHDLDICWHFIGHIQSNKTRKIAEQFHWIHSVDSLKIAQRLAAHNPHPRPLQICLQINIDDEDTKSGFALDSDWVHIVETITQLPNITLRGFMCIPDPTLSEDEKSARFQTLHDLLESINHTLSPQSLALDTLSMGMSDDYPLALAHGATIIRIGTAIFGARQYAT